MSDANSWFQDESFWEMTRPFMFPPERWEAAANSIEKIRTLLNIAPPAAVLDLCCGPGRFSIPLAQQGYRVTSVDRTLPLLNELRARAGDAALDLDIVESDMRAFCRPNTFDAAINMFTSFGYFEDPDDDRQVVRNVYTSLRPGGRLLMEMGHREFLIAHFQPRDWLEVDDLIVLEGRKWIDDFTRLHNRWVVIRGPERREWEFDLRVYGAADLGRLLREVGFSEVAAYGSLDGTPCDLHTNRLVMVATK